jgi:hypothetical protein
MVLIVLLTSLFTCFQVKEQGPKGGEQSPYLAELLRLEEVAKQQGLGRWSKVSNIFCLQDLFFYYMR